MHYRLKLLLTMLAAAVPEAYAGQSDQIGSDTLAAGGNQTTAEVAGSGNSGKTAAYLTDSRGVVVYGSGSECWRTGTWTPAQATVVGCDGVLARALPVPAPAPAPAEPEKAAPPAEATPYQVAPVPPASPGPEAAAVVIPREPASEKVTFDTDTLFDFDKAVLKPEGRQRLDTLAAQLSDTIVEVVVAVGHADSIGTQAYNQRLSERRAKAVANYLREKGLPKEKIFTEGKGETQPIASNASQAGRAKNRRVEVEVVGVKSKK